LNVMKLSLNKMNQNYISFSYKNKRHSFPSSMVHSQRLCSFCVSVCLGWGNQTPYGQNRIKKKVELLIYYCLTNQNLHY
jgi:hypothetical protein